MPKIKQINPPPDLSGFVSVYCDGSSSGKSNLPGGYGWIILLENRVIKCGNGSHPSTSNNRMEVTGALEGLRALRRMTLDTDLSLQLVSDSKYTLGMASGQYHASSNIELIEELRAEIALHRPIRYMWVKGHSKEPYNHMCDRLADIARRKEIEEIERSK